MVSGWILVKETVIYRVRHPCDRMPVCLLSRGEGPGDGVRSQAILDVRIFGDIDVVIVVYEGMAVYRVVQHQRRNYQEKAENYVALFGG